MKVLIITALNPPAVGGAATYFGSVVTESAQYNDEVQLALVGVNREGQPFLDQVRRTPGATHLGHIPHSDALALMRTAEIVAQPSCSEGVLRMILEAVALVTKVIYPAGIPGFERHLPQSVLPSISSDAISEMLDCVWLNDHQPSYPLSEHEVDRIVQDLANVYRQAI